MPHFVIDCSSNILNHKKPDEILNAVYQTAADSGLFDEGDIKVRINPFDYFKLGESKDSFIHIFANIMEGRTGRQKEQLSASIITKLESMFTHVPIISMNVRDFDKSGYCNKSMVG